MQSSWFPTRKVNEFSFWVSYIKQNLTDGNRMKTSAVDNAALLLTSAEVWSSRTAEGQGPVLQWKKVRGVDEVEIRSVAFRKREWESSFTSKEYMLFCLEAHVVVEDVALFQKHHGLEFDQAP